MRRRSDLTPAGAAVLVTALCLTATGSAAGDGPGSGSESAVRVVESRPVAAAPACTGTFVAHPLDHTIQVDERPVGFYASNGSGLAAGDLDGGGDLDIAVNNLLSPAVVFENRLCGGASLQVALRRPGTGNRYALGARVSLVTSAGTYVRQMRSTAGYLSGEPPRLHFGLPAGARIDALSIIWPDGLISHLRGDARLAPGRIVTIESPS